MRLVYIACPLAASTEEQVDANIAFAKLAALKAMNQGLAPFVPHLMYPAILDDNDPDERAAGIRMDEEILSRCDLLWVCGTCLSRGVQEEMAFAEAHGIPIERIVFDPTKEPAYRSYPNAALATGAIHAAMLQQVQSIIDKLLPYGTKQGLMVHMEDMFVRFKAAWEKNMGDLSDPNAIETTVKTVLSDLNLL